MKKILITGGAGYIGSHTVRYLIENKVDPNSIYIFDSLIKGHKEFIPEGINFIEGNLLDKSAIDEVFSKNEIDCVIHFAGFIEAGESMINPGKYFENNVLGGLNLLEAMRSGNCSKIIFSSTAAVYGVPKAMPIDEEAEKEPINPYGESKLIFEKMLKWFGISSGVRSISLRYFNAAGAAYGIGEAHNPETHLIPNILSKAKKGDTVTLFGDDYNTPDGTCIRDYIHVLDLADAHFKALNYFDQAEFTTECFNLGTGKGSSIKEVIKYSEEVVGHPIRVDFQKRRLGDSEILIASPKKADEKLHWQATRGIKECIESAWQWHQKR